MGGFCAFDVGNAGFTEMLVGFKTMLFIWSVFGMITMTNVNQQKRELFSIAGKYVENQQGEMENPPFIEDS